MTGLDDVSAELEQPAAGPPGRARARLRQFDEWVRGLDFEKTRSTITTKMFVGILLQGLGLIVVAAWVPGTRDFFRLRPLPAVCLLVLATLPGFVMGYLEPRARLSLRLFGVLSLLGSCFFQAFVWSLVALTRMPAAALLVALPIILVAFHGHLYQSGAERPLPFVAALVALALTLLVGIDSEHVVVFVVAAPLALGTHLLFGYQSRLDHLARGQREALRAAVDAQVLRERSDDVSRLAEQYDELRGRLHDAGNLMAAVLLHAPELIRALESEQQTELASSLHDRLQRLARLLSHRSSVRPQAGVEPASVEPWSVVVKTAEEVRRLQPDVRLVLSPPNNPQATVALHGGSEALQRAVFNVLLNACEGNGSERATRVQVSMSESTVHDELVLHISDNGPGFAPELLAAPLDQPRTTKSTGSGLGLYTSSRVLAASAARLTRSNRSTRGALVSIIIPRGHPPS